MANSEQELPDRQRRYRFRFTLFALLLVLTLICLFLGWWQYIYLEDQRLLVRRDLLTQRVADLSKDWKRKYSDYIEIAHSMGKVESNGRNVLLELDLKRMERIETDLMRLEDQQLEIQLGGKSDRVELLNQRIAELRKRHGELENELARHAEVSTELVALRDELDHDRRIIDDFAQKLEDINIEIRLRGISSTPK